MKVAKSDPRLSWPDRWFALKSIFFLQSMALALRLFGFNRLYTRINQSAAPGSAEPVQTTPSRISEAAHIGQIVGTANRRFRSLLVPCLPESLTVLWLLRRRSIPAVLRLGVKKQDSSLDAHAWVEYDGQVISGDSNLPSAYTPVDLQPAPK